MKNMQKNLFQAQFGSIFFYSLPVCKLSRRGGKVERKSSSLDSLGFLNKQELILEKSEASKKLFILEINRMKRLSILIGDKKVLSDKEKKSALVGAKQRIDSAFADFKFNLKTAKNEDEIDTLLEKAQDDMEQAKEIVNQAVEIAKRRTAMKEGLRNHQGKVYAEIWDYHETLKEHKDDAAWKHLKLVTVAYLHKWKKLNTEAIDKLTSSELNLLYSQFDKNKKEFTSGILVENLDEIKSEIKTGVMNKWLKGEERKVYKSEDWTDGFNAFKRRNPHVGKTIFDSDRDIFDDFDAFVNKQSSGKKIRLGEINKMLESIPLPDLGEGAPVIMTSDLVGSYFRKLERKMVAETLKQRASVFSKIKKLSGIVQTQELEELYAKTGLRDPKTGKYPKGLLKAWVPKFHKAKYLNVIQEETQIMQSIVNANKSKPSVKVSQMPNYTPWDFSNNLSPIAPKVAKSASKTAPTTSVKTFTPEKAKEKVQAKPQINDVFLSVNEKGLNIGLKGVNLNQKSFKPFKLSYKEMKVKAFMNVGKSNLDNKFTIHNAVKSYVKANLQRFAEQNKIPDNKIGGLPSEEMKKMEALVVKKYAPTFQVIGSASFDGGYSYNKQLARRRMKASVRRIKAQYGEDVKIKEVAMVVDSAGKEIKPSGISAAWGKVQSLYAEEFDKKLSISQIKRKLALYDNASSRGKMNTDVKSFFKHYFGANRNVEVQLIPTKNKTPLEIAVKVDNSGTEANMEFASNTSVTGGSKINSV